ncbi:MAG: aminoacyl-tRNA hydrolase [Pseudomonadota bacterium]
MSVNPWLVAGLGNPGSKYAQTRHNAGFWFIEALADRVSAALSPNRKLKGLAARSSWQGMELVLLKPDTFMNDSGQSLRAAMAYYRIAGDRVLIAHDELDLSPGTARLKWGGGHGGHNGLRSSFSHLSTQDFWRLRIGIGHPGLASQVTPWVLSRAPRGEQRRMDESIQRSVEVMPDFLNQKSERAMQVLHVKQDDRLQAN